MKNNHNADSSAARRVRLDLHHETAEEVLIAGSFNGWKPYVSPMIALGAGNWAKELLLPPGRYEYLLVVDGQWMFDPNAQDYVPNPFGAVNSVLIVPD